jgi:hypothetical protein
MIKKSGSNQPEWATCRYIMVWIVVWIVNVGMVLDMDAGKHWICKPQHQCAGVSHNRIEHPIGMSCIMRSIMNHRTCHM